MALKIDGKAFAQLGKILQPPEPPPPPPKKKKRGASASEGWAPSLTPKQQEAFDSSARYILAYGEKGSGKCTSPDSQVFTGDGLMRLRRIADKTLKLDGLNSIAVDVVGWDGAKPVRAKTSHVWIEPNNDARRVSLAHGGEIIGSPRHPIWVCCSAGGRTKFGWKTTAEMEAGLEKGERYWTPLLAHPSFTKTELQALMGITITPVFAYTLGALCGDGSLNVAADDRSLAFSNTDPECLAMVRRGLAQVGASLSRSGKSCSYYIVKARALRRFIIETGMAKLSYHKRIPDVIIESPKPVLAAFLQGLFDTDGTVDKAGNVSFTTTSEWLALDVQWALQALGVLSIRRPKKSASGNPTWNVNAFGKWAREFGRIIGFSISRKQERIHRLPKVSSLCPKGDNANRYGLPLPICAEIRKLWTEFLARAPRSRAWHNEHRRYASAFKGCVPSAAKVRDMLALVGIEQSSLAQYFVSENWVEVTHVHKCQSELMDLSVPATESFLANGMVQHNTIGLLHKMVRHAYENNNALCLIVVRVKSMATKGGAFDKLNHHILPRWRDGNRDSKTGELIDDGLQIEFSEVKYDAQHNEYIWVENRHGNWSMVVLISAQHSHQLRERIRGYEPSFVLVDELTSCDTIEYLRAIAAQIGRREGIDGPQQYTAACNPEGPSHWVYKAWFEDPFDPTTGEWDPDYHKIHVPIEDNRKNLPDGYLENLAKLYKSDPIEAARMLNGVWVERPSGEALFLDVFIPTNHVKPAPGSLDRIMPEPDYPIIIGMDPGATNNSYSFMQWYPVDGAMKWIVFDEIVYTQRRITYRILVPSILRRLAHWNACVFGHGVKKRFRVAWNSDTSAFNQFRAAQGSFDAMEFEKIANAKVGGLPPLHETLGVAKMKITPAPKFQGSVIARVRLTMDLLSEDRLLVSAGCPRHIEMFQKLESEKCKPGQPYDGELALTPRRSAHLHPFDSMSYPLLTGSIVPQLLNPAEESSGAQSMFTIGS